MSNNYDHMMSAHGGRSKGVSNVAKYSIMAAVTVLLCGASFYSGMKFQGNKSDEEVASANTSTELPSFGGQGGFNGGAPGGGFNGGQRPNIGEVQEVSSSSITVEDSRASTTKTYKINSSTQIQDNGSTASVSDIKAGDNVLVITDSSDTSLASQIMLNPNFGAPGGAPGSSSL